MSQTITIDIINNKAFELLKDLEQLKLIKLHPNSNAEIQTDWVKKYKGKMTKQPISEIENKLNEIRNGWE